MSPSLTMPNSSEQEQEQEQEEEEDDPITASYTVYLTPAQQNQLLLLQFPNRAPERPYNDPSPSEVRLKPRSGHLEMDIPLLTNGNFNKYQALRWGSTQPSHGSTSNGEGMGGERGTYGISGGLTSHFMTTPSASSSGPGRRRGSTTTAEEERDHELASSLASYADAEQENKTLSSQTLAGQILRHDGTGDERGKPLYFVGAFRGSELHLSQIAGTAQMRPVFHHIDAEDTASRAAGRAAAAEAETGGRPDARPRIVHQSYKSGPAGGTGNPKGELEEQSANLTKALRDAAEEGWVRCGFVDDFEDVAGEAYGSRLFNHDVGNERCRPLKAGWGKEEWVDALTAPSLRGSVKRRRAGKKGAGTVEEDGDEVDVG